MIPRPVPARWFEALVLKAQGDRALEALTAGGGVELEAREGGAGVDLPELADIVARFRHLRSRYGRWWPAPPYSSRLRGLYLGESARRAIGQLEEWVDRAEGEINAIVAFERSIRELRLWRAVATELAGRGLELDRLAGAGPLLEVVCYRLPAETDAETLPALLGLWLPVGGGGCLLVLVPTAQRPALDAAMPPEAQVLPLPDWMRADPEEVEPAIERRLAVAEEEHVFRTRALRRLDHTANLDLALGDLQRLAWFVDHVAELPASAHLLWISGWTRAEDPEPLQRELDRRGVTALVHFPAPPAERRPPLLLHNPPWARPFELFARALGVPAAHEVDPSRIVAVLVPLLFGYMFGDVGQGLVLLAAGLWLRRRTEFGWIVAAGGASATLFGFVFGSVFAREDLIPALWLHPVHAPLTVMFAPLAAAVLLLALGLVLRGMESCWRRGSRWCWGADAGMLVTYLGLLAALAEAALWPLPLLGVALAVAAAGLAEGRAGAGLAALGEMVEKTLQIAVNTLSFVRVGAFALAHAGLSSVVVSLADSMDSGLAALLILLLGNGVILLLEGLVVSIQTTRLVLFEFFVRFLTADGRPFRPLPAPPATYL